MSRAVTLTFISDDEAFSQAKLEEMFCRAKVQVTRYPGNSGFEGSVWRLTPELIDCPACGGQGGHTVGRHAAERFEICYRCDGKLKVYR